MVEDVKLVCNGRAAVPVPPQQRKERQGVNPRTGERVTIPAARVPKFSAGSALKQALKSG